MTRGAADGPGDADGIPADPADPGPKAPAPGGTAAPSAGSVPILPADAGPDGGPAAAVDGAAPARTEPVRDAGCDTKASAYADALDGKAAPPSQGSIDPRLVAFEKATADLRALLAAVTARAGGRARIRADELDAATAAGLRVTRVGDDWHLSLPGASSGPDPEPASGPNWREEEAARSAAVRANLQRRVAELLAQHGGADGAVVDS